MTREPSRSSRGQVRRRIGFSGIYAERKDEL